MLLRGLLLSLCTVGILGFSASSLWDSTLQLVSNSKTFYRVDKSLSWNEAMRFCQETYTDLADLQSLNSMSGVMTLISHIKDTAAWIGLFYNVQISGLSWSSGSTFTTITWSDLPDFREGFCAILYLQYNIPTLGAASCTAQKPFICYYDSDVGHRISSASALEDVITLPKEGEVNIGGRTFTKIAHATSWSTAMQYCRNHYTDLADLQVVTDQADIDILMDIINTEEAWIGLYFNAKSSSLTWSSGWDAGIPQWVENQPMFGKGLCAGMRSFANKNPRIYAVVCSKTRFFICFYDPSIGHRKSAEMPSLFDTPSSEVTHISAVTVGATSRPSAGTSTDPAHASEGLASATWLQHRGRTEPTEINSVPVDASTSTPSPADLSTTQPQGIVSLSPLTTPSSSEVTMGSSTSSLSRSSVSPWSRLGAKERDLAAFVSGNSAELQRNEPPSSATGGQVASTEPGSLPGTTPAMIRVEDGTDVRDTTAAVTQAQLVSSSNCPESTEKPAAAKSGHSYGILKADFTISTLNDPDKMKDQFLSEIHEVLKLILGHEQFTLKWVGLEVNKK